MQPGRKGVAPSRSHTFSSDQVMRLSLCTEEKRAQLQTHHKQSGDIHCRESYIVKFRGLFSFIIDFRFHNFVWL